MTMTGRPPAVSCKKAFRHPIAKRQERGIEGCLDRILIDI